MIMQKLLSTKEVAEHLGVNEKMIYTLVAEKGLPASKVTGKWLFPERLVLQWIEANTINYPGEKSGLFDAYPSLFVIAGSNDVLLDRTMGLFMNLFPEYTAVFGNLGSLGGVHQQQQAVLAGDQPRLAHRQDGPTNIGSMVQRQQAGLRPNGCLQVGRIQRTIRRTRQAG